MEKLPIALACLFGGAVSYIMWFKIAKPLGKWLTDRLPPGRLRSLLLRDMGGDY